MKVTDFYSIVRWTVLACIAVVVSVVSAVTSRAENQLVVLFAMLGYFAIPSFVVAGIVNLLRKATGHDTYLEKSFFGNMLLSLVFLPILMSIGDVTLNLVIASIVALIVLVIHTVFFNRTGLSYGKLLKKAIEAIFRVRITPVDGSSDSGRKTSARETKKGFSISALLGNIALFFPSTFVALKTFVKKNKKRVIIVSSIAGGILIVVAAVIFVSSYLYSNMYAKVLEASPSGLTNNRTSIKVLYSDPIEFKNPDKPGSVFAIEPALNGVAKIEGRTLYFVPDTDLPSSAKYKVTVHPEFLVSKSKSFVAGVTFDFYTRLMEVANLTAYYSMDEDTGRIESLVCEASFTLPVDRDSLTDRIKATLDGKDLPFTVEQSEQPGLVYLAVRGFAPGETAREITILFKKGIKPASGLLPLANDMAKSVTLREMDRLTVEECSAYPVSGNTYVAIKFNQPVNERTLRSYLSVTPAIDYTISTEYRYAVLQAQFAVNTSYSIAIAKGMTSDKGLVMKNDFTSPVFIKDMEPYVRFTSEGKVLPLTANLNIEFVSLNLDRVRLTLEKVYKNNLVYYLRTSGYDEEYNTERKYLYSTDIDIEGGALNEEIKNLVNLSKLRESKYEGLYYISIADTKEYYNYARMLVHVTNTGLIVKNDRKNLAVYAVNVLSLAPSQGVKVTLVSAENQVLGEEYTDGNGKAVFEDYTNTEEKLTPYMVFAEGNEGFTYLRLNTNTLDYSTFDTEGSTYTAGSLDCFVNTERGVYRPGEPVFATLIARKTNLANPEPVPLIIEAKDPTGTVVFDGTVKIDESGIATLSIPTRSTFATGEYSLVVKQDGSRIVGSATFKIEEFIPATIQASAELVSQAGGTFAIRVKSRELHGAPSNGLKVESSYRFSSRTYTSAKYPGYRFYDDSKNEFNEARIELGEGSLDENGEIVYSIDIPPSLSPPSALNLLFYTDVYDTSGRPVGAFLSVAVNRYNTYYGLAIDGKKPFVRDGKTDIGFVALSADDKPVKRSDVTVKVKRKLWYTIFRKYGWTEKYTSERFEELVFTRTLPIDGRGTIPYTPDKGGEYTITISEKGGMTSSLTFFVYDNEAETYTDMNDPAKIVLTLDKTSYAPGDTAYLSVRSPLAGKCMISVERDRSYNTFYVDCPNGKATVPIVVSADYIPNVYVTVMAFRKPEYELEYLPPVSYGAINIQMDKSKLGQEIRLETKKKIRAQDGLEISCYLPGGAGSKVVLAAVDEGILMITDYKSGDPYDFFFRKRALGVTTSTTLKDLLPDIAPYKKAFGGGDDAWARRHLNPFDAKRVKSVALFSGVLTCDERGRVKYKFNVGEFNGTLRVMAMSAKNAKFGSSQDFVTVTDPIVLSPGIPRILAPGDSTEIPIRVFNKTGKDGKITVRLETRGPLAPEGKASVTLDIKNEAEEEFTFKVKATKDAGIGTITLYGSGNAEQTKSETELAIRPAVPVSSRTNTGAIEPGKSAVLEIKSDYIPAGKYVRLAVSPHKLVRSISALDELIRYPYGCVEQLVSQTFPMLYLADYAMYSPDFKGNRFMVDKYIDTGIKAIEERLLPDGSFSMWPGGAYGYPYVSDYASHFLIEARRLGYTVSDKVYDAIIGRLGMKEEEKGRLDRREQNVGSMVPYHIFIRALAGKPDADAMRSFYDTIRDQKRKSEVSETDRILIGAAYGIAGDKAKAREMLPDNFEITTLIRQCTGQFGSYIRNTALYLYAMTLIDPSSQTISKLENDLINRLTQSGSYGSTQETAWVLIALSSVAETSGGAMNADLVVDGKPYKKLTEQTVLTNEIKGAKLSIVNNGTSPVYYNLYSFGYPQSPTFAKEEKGMTVTREYRNLDGTLIDTSNVKKGTQVVVTLSVKLSVKPKEKIENVVLLDLLPAGFEIENTRLESRSDISGVEENDIAIDYSDIRDDRIILYIKDFTGTERYSYVVRAVSAGDFVIPQFLCEAMYDPELFGKNAGGERLVITDEK